MITRVAFFLCITTIAVAGTAVHTPRSTGRDYYLVFPKAAWGNQSVGVLINSPTKQKIVVTTPSGATGIINFTQAKFTQYYAGQFRIESKPGFHQHEATRLQSPNAISVIGQFGVAGISGTYTALPVSAWGSEYFAVAPPEGTNIGYYNYPKVYSVPMITIIAYHAGTIVTITPTALTSLAQLPGVAFTQPMNGGDVYNVTTAGDPQSDSVLDAPCQADLSGTHITSNYPVGVIVAQSHTSWPCGNNDLGDYTVEWLPPVANWDSLYVMPASGSANGDAVRMIAGYDNTVLTVASSTGQIFSTAPLHAGEVVDDTLNIPATGALIISGTHPFLPVQITKSPASNNATLYYTLGMTMITGVHEWSAYNIFSTAIGSQSVAYPVFRFDQIDHIMVNGTPARNYFSKIDSLPQGFATAVMLLNGGAYYEFSCDSGATIGGSVFGYGTLANEPGGDRDSNGVQSPHALKSFAHPVSGNMTPLNSLDATPPFASINYSCGHWDVTAFDTGVAIRATGLNDVWLDFFSAPDTSANVQFNTAPQFEFGDARTSFGIDVINLAQPAQAALHLRDQAGNEFDTVLNYTPQNSITTTPQTLSIALVRNDSAEGKITLFNTGATPATIASYHLKNSSPHAWSIDTARSPQSPVTIPANGSVDITLQYSTIFDTQFQTDIDTLYATTCRDFPIATLSGTANIPGIEPMGEFFGDRQIDTILFSVGPEKTDTNFLPGDTVIGIIYVKNNGGDTLHVSGLQLIGSATPPDTSYPASDYRLFGIVGTDQRTMLPMPTVPSPILIPAGKDIQLKLQVHPHQLGFRYAGLVVQSDAGSGSRDTASLSVFGTNNNIIASSINYGKNLYGTVRDSFFVVWNIGADTVNILRDGFNARGSADTSSFMFMPYHDKNSGVLVDCDTTKNIEIIPQDSAHPTSVNYTLVPFRFVANSLGVDTMSLLVTNTSAITPVIVLQGNVVQPHVAGASYCPPNTITIGDTLIASITIWNAGTDSMMIESLAFTGEQSASWKILHVDRWHDNQRSIMPAGLITLQPLLDTAYAVVQMIATSSQLPATQLRITGIDGLHRHANDSIGATYYAWNIFPYDTTLPVYSAPCVSDVNGGTAQMPVRPVLWANYPNPFSSTTALRFSIASPSEITLRVTNILGETVAVIAHDHREAGMYVLPWDAAALPPGIYYCELDAAGEKIVMRIAKM